MLDHWAMSHCIKCSAIMLHACPHISSLALDGLSHINVYAKGIQNILLLYQNHMRYADAMWTHDLLHLLAWLYCNCIMCISKHKVGHKGETWVFLLLCSSIIRSIFIKKIRNEPLKLTPN